MSTDSGVMSVAYDHFAELHQLIDQLDEQQAEDVRRYTLRLVGAPEAPARPHRLSFTGIGSSDNPQLAAQAKEIIRRELRGVDS
jgi:hypothetical protein